MLAVGAQAARNRRAHLPLSGLLICGLVTLLGVMGSSLAIADPGVAADDDHDEYVGSSSLLLIEDFDGSDTARRQAAVCDGCRWRVTVLCPSDIAVLDRNPDAVVVNPHPCPADSSKLCPVGTRRLHVYFAAAARMPLARVGTTCVGPAGPLRRTTVESWVHEVRRARLPALSLTLNKATAIRGSKIQGRVGPARTHRWQVSVSGHRLTIQAVATVTVRWGDGSQDRSQGVDFTHTWARANTFHVRADAVWTASYWIDGRGPWRVPGQIRQDARAPITIVSTVTRLVPMGSAG